MNNITNKVSRTVYSIGWEKTKEIFKQVQKNPDLANLFSETWTKKQDNLHIPFLNQWRQWVSPRLIFSDDIKHAYPTNGSSEAICQQLNYLQSKGKTLVVFDGEYEGYEMFAKNMGISVKKIIRPNSENSFSNLYDLDFKKDVFFISEPSAIDGNHWKFFFKFMDFCEKNNMDVYIDACYVGLSRQKDIIDVSKYLCVAGVFFSLSKIFGVYYHRIGGVWLRDENPLLWPNLWFKNLYAINYGQELLKAMPIGYMDNQLEKISQKISNELSSVYKINIFTSDVYLLLNLVSAPEQYDWHKQFLRSSSKDELLRICISQLIEESFNH